MRGFIDPQGEKWYCAIDAASALSLTNFRATITRVCREPGGIGHRITDTGGKREPLMYLSEGNLRRLVARCKKVEADAYLDWVLDDLAPRQRGPEARISAARESEDGGVERPGVAADVCLAVVRHEDNWLATGEGRGSSDPGEVEFAPLPLGGAGAVVRGFRDTEGRRWYCALDVARCLGVLNSSAMVAQHCLPAAGIVRKATQTISGTQEITFLSEYNLRRLILRSCKPEAEAFFDWALGQLVPDGEEPRRPQLSPALIPEPDPAPRPKAWGTGMTAYEQERHWEGVQLAPRPGLRSQEPLPSGSIRHSEF
ncbi:BRO family protein [Cupriavidus sp. D39]|uniref:BRO family protein n=1 Tax=Cupriavidus sp. D39 TaxID=2997877 RepID=UPI00226DA430|nr:BRO family protein [Cupriavidus sp. D39]MCY0853647.1 BRO family protein [Cupriavidus sp. D39]